MVDQYSLASARSYDGVAGDYLNGWADKRPRGIAQRFAQQAGPEAVVLDVASGPGLDVRLLRDMGIKPVSGDLSFGVMQVAQTHHPRGLLACWDFQRLPFADNTFDGIWAPGALHHLPRRAFVPVLKEWMRVQARGPIVLSVPEGDEDLGLYEDPPLEDPIRASKCTQDQLQGLLLSLGYVGVEVEVRLDPRGTNMRWVHAWGVAPT
ncbi:class I SAM-dependent methyltransferase [Stomatohabitans albus]|uniref:class I SAM-dependent methyltransferase n=2 Tax=Stomatohabitans albus TaxID=3110766 RepID=UPI00300D7420